MLHCFKRFTKAAGSSWKEGHIGNSGVGKRVVSTLIVFLMVFSLVQGFNSNVHAASPGFTEMSIEKTSDGLIHIYGSGIPTKAGSSQGSIGLGRLCIEYTHNGVTKAAYLSGASSIVSNKFAWTSDAKSAYTVDVLVVAPVETITIKNMSWDDYTGGTGIQRHPPSGTANYLTPITGLTPMAQTSYASRARVPSVTVYNNNPVNGGFTFSYRVSEPGGSPLQSFKLKYREQGATAWSEKTLPMGPTDIAAYVYTSSAKTSTIHTMSGLKNGVTYEFYVEATNDTGAGKSTTFTVTPGSASAPRNIVAVPQNGSVKYTWTAPADLAGGTVIGYVVRDGTASGGILAQPTTTEYVRTQANGTISGSGIVHVAAKTKLSDGMEVVGAYGASNANIVAGTPAQPTAPTVTKASSAIRNYTVSWTAPNNNGSTITKYHIYLNNAFVQTVSGTTTSVTRSWTTAQDNSTLQLSIVAENQWGTSVRSANKAYTTYGVPAAPTLSSVAATGLDGYVLYMLKPQGNHRIFL